MRTAAFVWVVARAAFAVLGVIVLSSLGQALFVLLVLGMTWFDIRVTSERILYGNLGIPPLVISLIAVASAASLEVLLGLVFGGFFPGFTADVPL